MTDYEKYYFLGYDTVQSDRSLLLFQRYILPPASGWKSKPSKKQADCCDMLVFCFLVAWFNSLIVKGEAVHSSNMSDFCQTTWHHCPEDSNLLENSGLLGSTALCICDHTCM